ncbi:hypothetical protein CK203_077209 [Vitis vinifera]|uniref:Uncharacterized protein n=1 Tax=Vitis vinifera TaxID=29760 RepID=A0A438BU91_VITVI|nr:hypothetical protein CK203_077209 [Vitis vinifera]
MQFLHQLNKGVRRLFVHIVVFKGTQSTNAIKYMVPGHKPRSKNNLNVQANQAAAAVSTDSPSQNLTLSQVQQLIALLSSQLHAGDSISSEIVQPIASFSSIHGILSLSSISNSHQFSHSCWVLDTGDKHHISCTLDLTQGVTIGRVDKKGTFISWSLANLFLLFLKFQFIVIMSPCLQLDFGIIGWDIPLM